MIGLTSNLTQAKPPSFKETKGNNCTSLEGCSASPVFKYVLLVLPIDPL